MIDISTTNTYFNNSDYSVLLDDKIILENDNKFLQSLLFISLIFVGGYIVYSHFQINTINNKNFKTQEHE